MVMCLSLSVVINIINVVRAVVKTEDKPPVGANGDGVKTLHLALEWM
jgi:hypothetical protein